VRKLEDAIQRQQAIQRKRTRAWALFGILVPVSLLFWLEVIFAVGHMPEIGILQLLLELLIALVTTLAVVHAFRSGMQFNKLLADTSRLLDDDAE
jgi:hypothetical protein